MKELMPTAATAFRALMDLSRIDQGFTLVVEQAAQAQLGKVFSGKVFKEL